MNRKKIALILTSGIFSLGFLFLLIFVLNNGGLPIDFWIVNNIDKIRNENLTKIIKILTYLGQFLVLFGMCFIAFFVLFFKFKDKSNAVFLLANLSVSAIVSTIIKYTVRRPRPVPTILTDIGFSFPSAHAMLSLAFYLSLAIVIAKHIKSKVIKSLLYILSIMIVIFISFTRLYLGVHYFSDCLVGIVLACALTPIVYLVVEKK